MASSSKEEPKSAPWSLKVSTELSSIIETINLEREKLEEDREAFEKEKLAWRTAESKLEVSQLGDLIMLNVGGTLFACSIELLQKIPDTYFSGLASGRWNLKQQKDGSVFIDREPTVFPLIMTYMRKYGTDFNLSTWRRTLSDREKLLLADEAEFFMLPELLNPPYGAVLGAESWKSIHPSYEKRQLLFTSNDQNTTFVGAMAGMRNKMNMIAVCKLPNGTIVGAFTSIAWNFSGNYQSDPTAVLFYRPSDSAPLSKHTINPAQAMYATSQTSNAVNFGGSDLKFAMSATTGQFMVSGSQHSFMAQTVPANPQVLSVLEIWALQ